MRLLPAAAFGALLSVAPASAQSDGDHDRGEAAHLFAYYPKEGMREQFDEGYRRHLDWHRERHDPLVWYGWYVTLGERTGLFIDGSFGQPFGAFDTRVDPSGDAADFARTTAQFADPAFRSTYVVRRDLSTGHPLEEGRPARSVQVFHYVVRPGMEARFERAVTAVRAALLRRPEVPEHTWYELVVGGESPAYMLMVARENWASYDAFHLRLSDLVAEARGTDEADALVEGLAASVKEVRSESWSYRSDLSYFPDR